MVGRRPFFTGPAFVDDVRQFLGNIEAPAIPPAVLEPVRQLHAGIAVQHIDVQFTLMGETGQGEIAAAQITDHRVHRVLPVQQIQLGVQQVAQIDLDHEPVGAQLGRELAERAFIRVGRHAESQLLPKFLGHAPLFADRGLVIEGVVVTVGPQDPA